jgi:hypothetical protein
LQRHLLADTYQDTNMTDAVVEQHFPTAHLRRLRRKVQGSDSTSYEETVLQQRWLPMVAGQGRTEEWRDVPIVMEGEDG